MPASRTRRLNVESLEDRNQPALWTLEMLSPPQGDASNFTAPHSGELQLASASVNASSVEDAIGLAVGGTITVGEAGESIVYQFGASQAAFQFVVDEGTVTIQLDNPSNPGLSHALTWSSATIQLTAFGFGDGTGTGEEEGPSSGPPNGSEHGFGGMIGGAVSARIAEIEDEICEKIAYLGELRPLWIETATIAGIARDQYYIAADELIDLNTQLQTELQQETPNPALIAALNASITTKRAQTAEYFRN